MLSKVSIAIFMRSRLGGSLVCQWHGSRLLNASACCMEDQIERLGAILVQPLCVKTTVLSLPQGASRRLGIPRIGTALVCVLRLLLHPALHSTADRGTAQDHWLASSSCVCFQNSDGGDLRKTQLPSRSSAASFLDRSTTLFETRGPWHQTCWSARLTQSQLALSKTGASM